MASLEKSCTRSPTPQAVWVHQIHAACGVGGSATMVMVFVRSLCCVLCVLVLSGCRHLSYVDKYKRITLRWGYRHHTVAHLGLHHTLTPPPPSNLQTCLPAL